MSDSKSLAGRYKTKTSHVVAPDTSSGSTEPILKPAGAVLSLSHEEAVLGLTTKTIEPFDSRGCSACKKFGGYRPCSIECYAALGGSMDQKAYHEDMVMLETKLALKNKAARARVEALDKEEIDLTKDSAPPPPPEKPSATSTEGSSSPVEPPPVKSGRKPAPEAP